MGKGECFTKRIKYPTYFLPLKYPIPKERQFKWMKLLLGKSSWPLAPLLEPFEIIGGRGQVLQGMSHGFEKSDLFPVLPAIVFLCGQGKEVGLDILLEQYTTFQGEDDVATFLESPFIGVDEHFR